ncbi:MAG: amidohydrolase family protein [Vicinamibacteria bacterium]
MKAKTAGCSLVVAILLAGSENALAQSSPAVIRAKKIYTVTEGTVDDGEILIQDGKIRQVGKRVEVPVGAQEFTAEVVIPGMIDAHSHMALDRGFGGRGRSAGPVTAEWKAVERFNPRDPMIGIALSGGVTSMIVRSGSGIVSSGQAVAVKLKSDPSKNMILKPYVDLKMAIRPLIRIRPGETPATLMGWYATASEYFRQAKEYVKAWEDYRAGRTSEEPERNERLEAFAAVLRGEVMVHVHSHYPGEVMMAMHLAREYGFIDRMALSHVQDAYPIAEILAKTRIVSVVGPEFITRFHGDPVSHNVVKELMEAGAAASIQTDKSGEQAKCFREYGSFLIRHGLKEEHALAALTIHGARAMMMEDRIGSIEAGKDADLVLMNGPPFDLHAERIEKVFLDGVVEFERTEWRQTELPTQVGPFRPMKGGVRPGDRSFVIANAHIFTVSQGNIPRGEIVVRDGKIAEVGAATGSARDLPVLDVGGRVVLPGWVTARAYPNHWMGDLKWQMQNDEDTAPIVPEMEARFAFDPWFPSFQVIREIGITAQNVTPGHLNLIGGRGAVIKTAGMDVEKMVRKSPSSIVFSLDRSSIRHWAKDSQIEVTLETAADRIRKTLEEAKRYLEQEQPERYEARFEALRPLLSREIPAIFQASTEEEIRAAMELTEEFNLRLIVSGGVEAHKLAADLARQDVGVILGDSEYESIRGGGDGYDDRSPALLSRAGVTVSFFGASGSRRVMPTGNLGGEPALNAAWAFRNGASEQEALAMVTLNAAELAGMGDRIGSIDVGKDADFMVLEGHPFDYRVLPQMVFIDGELIFQRTQGRGRETTTAGGQER